MKKTKTRMFTKSYMEDYERERERERSLGDMEAGRGTRSEGRIPPSKTRFEMELIMKTVCSYSVHIFIG